MVTIKLNEKLAAILVLVVRDALLNMWKEVDACTLTTPPNVKRILVAARDNLEALSRIIDAAMECDETQDMEMSHAK